jgi:hypothetical protein
MSPIFNHIPASIVQPHRWSVVGVGELRNQQLGQIHAYSYPTVVAATRQPPIELVDTESSSFMSSADLYEFVRVAMVVRGRNEPNQNFAKSGSGNNLERSWSERLDSG